MARGDMPTPMRRMAGRCMARGAIPLRRIARARVEQLLHRYTCALRAMATRLCRLCRRQELSRSGLIHDGPMLLYNMLLMKHLNWLSRWVPLCGQRVPCWKLKYHGVASLVRRWHVRKLAGRRLLLLPHGNTCRIWRWEWRSVEVGTLALLAPAARTVGVRACRDPTWMAWRQCWKGVLILEAYWGPSVAVPIWRSVTTGVPVSCHSILVVAHTFCTTPHMTPYMI